MLIPERPPIAVAPLSAILLDSGDCADRDEVVAAWSQFLAGLRRPYEILLVSTRPAPHAAPHLAANTAVQCVPAAGVGPGAALRAGIAAAQHSLLFYTTANKNFQPNDLQLLLERIDKVDLVTGYRVGQRLPAWLIWLDRLQRWSMRLFLGMSRERRTSWVGWSGFYRRFLARWVFGVPVQDPECSFRLIRREILSRFPLQCDGPFVHVEVLAKVNFLGCMLCEVPVTCLPAAAPALDRADSRRMRAEIARLFRRPEFGSASLVAGTKA